MEHLAHFGLRRDPFINEPLPDFFFANPKHTVAEKRLQRAIQQGKGLSVLIGEPGSGKTLLARRLLEQLEEELFEVGLLVPLQGIADAGWVIDRFGQQLGIEQPAADRSELMAQLYEKLAIVHEEGRRTVLILDEAQVLAEGTSLQELRGLLNLEYEERRLLSLVLVGLPELGSAMARDASIAGRIDVKIQIEPLEPSAAAKYLAARVRRVGGDPGILDRMAVRALVEYAAGNPRLLNTLADNALFEAYLAGRQAASATDVEAAARGLDLPAAQLQANPDGSGAGTLDPASIPSVFETEEGNAAEPPLDVGAPAAGEAGEDAFPEEAQATRVLDQDSQPLDPEQDDTRVIEGADMFEAVAAEEPPPLAEPPPKEESIDELFTELIDEG